MDSTGEQLHPNWRALATLHIPLKRFVPAGNKLLTKQDEPCSNNKLSLDLTGEQVKEFYENVLYVEKNTDKLTATKMTNNHGEKRVKKLPVAKIPFESAKLFRAAMSNDVETIGNMHFVNNDINEKDQYGWTALMMSACENAHAAVELLLRLGANKHAEDKNGNTAEDLARKKGFKNIVDLLRNYPNKFQKMNAKRIKSIALVESKREEFYCETCKQTFTDTSQLAHSTSTLHRFYHKSEPPSNPLKKFNITPRNRGLKLMKKQGWDCASGLGPSQNGRLYPIKTVMRKDRTGLGVDQNPARVTHFHAYDLRATKSLKNHKTRTRNDIKREKVRNWKIDRRLRTELS